MSTERLAVLLAAAAYLIVIIWNGWLADDAYLTMRTVDNFVNGRGLTWNVGERVQIYTHPLWMFLLSAFYAFVRDPYIVLLGGSLLVSTAALILFASRITPNPAMAVVGVAIMTFSKAYRDYSTSGMENALSHLLLIVFVVLLLSQDASPKNVFLLSTAASLAAINRLDVVLLYLPPLAYILFRERSFKALLAAAFGFLPLAIWELFSFFYYGFPFPNTAYAKINTGIAPAALARQGLYYFADSFTRDPLTLTVIAAALVVAIIKKDWLWRAFAFGILLYALYVIRIGGDFMSGRFFSVLLLLAVIIIARSFSFSHRMISRRVTSRRAALISFIAVVVLGLLPRALYGDDPLARTNGVGDERKSYLNITGIRSVVAAGGVPDHLWVDQGLNDRARGKTLAVGPANGLYAFYGGPDLHVVDTHALGDALLARLPAQNLEEWKIGHFFRAVPEGYWKNEIQREIRWGNTIRDPSLSAYYEKLSLVIHGPLFSRARLLEVWRLNTGYYNHLLDEYLAAIE